MSNHSASGGEQSLRGMNRVLAWLSAVPVALIVMLTFADVLGRYLFASPVRGSVEMIEYAMALLIFTALPLVTRHRGHVTVSLIDNLIKGQSRRYLSTLCDGISAVALALLSWRLFRQAMNDMEEGAATQVLNMPHAPLSFALTLLAGISTLMVLVLIWRTWQSEGESA